MDAGKKTDSRLASPKNVNKMSFWTALFTLWVAQPEDRTSVLYPSEAISR